MAAKKTSIKGNYFNKYEEEKKGDKNRLGHRESIYT